MVHFRFGPIRWPDTCESALTGALGPVTSCSHGNDEDDYENANQIGSIWKRKDMRTEQFENASV